MSNFSLQQIFSDVLSESEALQVGEEIGKGRFKHVRSQVRAVISLLVFEQKLPFFKNAGMLLT